MVAFYENNKYTNFPFKIKTGISKMQFVVQGKNDNLLVYRLNFFDFGVSKETYKLFLPHALFPSFFIALTSHKRVQLPLVLL